MPKRETNRRRKAGVRNSAELISNNEDLLREILLRLPVRSLIRFKCVCKSWLTLISNSQFGYEHTNQNPNLLQSGVYFYLNPFSSKMFKTVSMHGHSSLPLLNFLDGVVKGSRAEIVHACNGLMLCSHGTRKLYSVCNLSTRKYTLLPELDDGAFTIWQFPACLAFDPAKSPYYKVMVIDYGVHGSSKMYIFSSKEASWKCTSLCDLPGSPNTQMVFLNGMFHWLSNDNVHNKLEVDAEKLTKTLMPRKPKIRIVEIRYFGECGGHLFLVLGGSHSYACRIFEMDLETSVWIEMYRVNLWQKIPSHVGQHQRFHVLSVLKRSNESDLTLVLAIPGRFMLYYLKCKTLESICDFPPTEFPEIPKYLRDYAHQFTESLFPV